ncbi:nitrate transporter [Sphingopyxis sp. H038]|uniref:CmpA/NrtA family ABC transporter substrate-binding protein n=1 Tax=unclassified Sphingopyxis TaxID=2614943 RepID=UPI00073165B1|nr:MULTISPECIES: CmpA/NrtA family ABC transporter substrate-binding protein [unclassified Sphingopyxis]KTE01962.1 nitrate transporter [Sphingopyxis sp. H012]KTE09711.1 nitrate transporter [Sphingopyxis sp. H053]KTE15104.1 nitrate transporter [Sphingopyxis sp. H093]KTE29813.1 nitrate transporter [Sphingopyxis sp. H080]KTE32958.1 nitrate transporter [Sphingopyxis sp. H038]
MSAETFRIGFLPLVDAALPILAHELGFAAREGISIELVRDMTWATVRDRLLYGHTDAAHMIAPLAIATALGRDRPAVPMAVPFVLGLNGNAVTFSTRLAKDVGLGDTLGDPAAIGVALERVAAARKVAGKPLRFGVVHRYSSHNYMLRYWLAGVGIRPDADVEIVVTSPPFAADALAAGEVDGICVGEPWNSIAVERGVGHIALATAQIWRRGVEKVLAMREAVIDERRDAVEALLRALHAAAAHFVAPGTAEESADLLARAEYLGASRDAVLRAITDRIRLVPGGEPIHYPDFMFQYREAANFPWRSQAAWLYSQMLRWDRADYSAADATTAAAVFRPDVYRAALAGSGAPLPGASSKLEGGIGEPLGAGSTQGRLVLGSDRFFDGRAFDPDDIQGYLADSN